MTRNSLLNSIIFIVILKVLVTIGKPKNTEFQLDEKGYNFSYQTADGQKRSESATINADDTISVSGSYFYTTTDGVMVEVTYVADELGYRPKIKFHFGVFNIDIPNRFEDVEEEFGLRILPAAAQSIQGGGLG